jgi:hypothetical protein
MIKILVYPWDGMTFGHIVLGMDNVSSLAPCIQNLNVCSGQDIRHHRWRAM